MPRSKISLHVHSLTGDADAKIRDFVLRANPTVVKFMTDAWNPDLWRWCRDQGCIVVLRKWLEPERNDVLHGDMIDEVADLSRRFPWAVHEGWNETHQNGQAALERRAEADIELMKICELAGAKACIGSFSVGNPHRLDDWRYYKPALRYARQGGHYLGLHEYGGPFAQIMAGGNQLGEDGKWKITDPCLDPGVDGWAMLRHRKVAAWLSSQGTSIPDVIITECGLDKINPSPRPEGARGYKHYLGTAWENLPHGNFAEQMSWYNDRLRETPYVIGATIFDAFDASGEWPDFDIGVDEPMLGRLIELVSDEHTPPDVPPSPIPPVDPSPVINCDGPSNLDVYPAATVLGGEGMYAVARRVVPPGLNYAAYARDIASANGMPWPPSLRKGQVVTLPSYKVEPVAGEPYPPPPPPERPLDFTHLVFDSTAMPTRHRYGIPGAYKAVAPWGIVCHDPAGNAANPPSEDAVLRYLQSNDRQVSVHYYQGKATGGGQVLTYRLASPEREHTWHVGPTGAWDFSPNPGGRPTYWTIGIECFMPADWADGASWWTGARLEAYVELVALLCLRYELPVDERVRGHGEIQSNRSDPRGLDMGMFRERVSELVALAKRRGWYDPEMGEEHRPS